MLDTNILIYAMRHPDNPVVDKIIEHAGIDICISSITLSELEFGIMRSADPLRNKQSLTVALAGIMIISYDERAALSFAEIKNDLMRKGLVIEDMDILIGAHAMSRGYTLVTDNVRHFGRIDNLAIENWIYR